MSGKPQESLLSGNFFNFIVDKLLTQLKDAHIGCHINGLFAGTIAYTGDIMLLSARVEQIKAILNIYCKHVVLRVLKVNYVSKAWNSAFRCLG